MKKPQLNFFNLVIVVALLVAASYIDSCGKDKQEATDNKLVLVYPSHLDNLYEEIEVGGKKLGIIHIYSDYPDYKWIEAKGEGIACIDDVARAAIFYSQYYSSNHERIYLHKVKMLTEFILFMQAQNGYFYNFIEVDYSINKTYKTSVAEPNWWSWRAAWALSETYNLFAQSDPAFADQIKKSMDKLFNTIKKNLPVKKNVKEIAGFERPLWLQGETGADQTSILILALTNYLKISKEPSLLTYLNDLCDGILKMQEGSETNFPYCAFMSWENLWHAYGNSQSYALLKTYEVTHNKKYLHAALKEIDNFYPYIIKKNYLNYFSIRKEGGNIIADEMNQFSQIAYCLRPMIFASLEAAKITKKKFYSNLAGKLSLWFFGKNISGEKMYDITTGICFDGINNQNSLNKNSGAESTIEALLSLSAVQNNKAAFSIVEKYLEHK